jgi:hypothetical protein
MIKTSCPDSTFPWSRRPCRAVRLEMARTAACSKVRLAGLCPNLCSGARVLGEGAFPDAEHLIPGLEPRHAPAERLHNPGNIHAGDGILWGTEPEGQSCDVGQAGHQVPDAPVYTCHVNAYQYLVVRDLGLVDVPKLQDIG